MLRQRTNRVNRVSRISRLGGGGATAPDYPIPPATAVFAALAHPFYCASDASHLTPCADGDPIRWWKEAVTGVWYEQATMANRPILRDAGGGKWYAEHASADHYVTFTGFMAAVTTVLWVGCAARPVAVSGNESAPPYNTKPGATGTLRGLFNGGVQALDGVGNPDRFFNWPSTGDHRAMAVWVQATGGLTTYYDGVANVAVATGGGGTLEINGPKVGGDGGGGFFQGRNYGVVYFASAQVVATVDAFLLTLMPP